MKLSIDKVNKKDNNYDNFDNVRVDKQWRVVSTMWNGAQNMWVMKDNVNALKWKGQFNDNRWVSGWAWWMNMHGKKVTWGW
jgi:hypothetical protein